MSKIRIAIGNALNYPYDFDFVDIIDEIINRIGNINNDTEVYEEIDCVFANYYKLWVIAKHYNATPFGINDYETLNDFTNDVLKVVEELRNA